MQLSQHISCTDENLTGKCIFKGLTARVVLTSVANTCVTEIYHSLQHFLICTLHRLSPWGGQSGSLRTPGHAHPSALVGPAHSQGIMITKQNQQSRGVCVTFAATWLAQLALSPPGSSWSDRLQLSTTGWGHGRGRGRRYAHTKGQKEERLGERGRTGAAVFPRCLPSNTVRATWTQATRRADLTHTHTRALRAGRGAAVGYRGAGVVQVVVAMWCYGAGLAPSLFIYIFNCYFFVYNLYNDKGSRVGWNVCSIVSIKCAGPYCGYICPWKWSTSRVFPVSGREANFTEQSPGKMLF